MILESTITTQPEADPLPNTALLSIPDGAAGIRATLNLMARFTRQYRTDLTLRRLAESIVMPIPGKSWYAEIEAIQNWVRNNIRYTKDIYDVETLKTPLLLIQNRFGDCDDMSVLTGTLLNTLGHPVRYIAIGTEHPGEFTHVYPETKVNMNRWVSVETTEDVPVGWIPAPITAYMVSNV